MAHFMVQGSDQIYAVARGQGRRDVRNAEIHFADPYLGRRIHALIADECARQPAGSLPGSPLPRRIRNAYRIGVYLVHGAHVDGGGHGVVRSGTENVRPEFHGLGNGVFLRGAQLPGGDFSFRLRKDVAVLFPLIKKAQLEQGGVCMVGYDARFIGRRLRFPEQEKRGGQRQAVEKTVPGHTSLLFTRPSCLYVDHIPLAFNGGSSYMSKHVRSALFYVLRRCGDICVKRGKKGGREGGGD